MRHGVLATCVLLVTVLGWAWVGSHARAATKRSAAAGDFFTPSLIVKVFGRHGLTLVRERVIPGTGVTASFLNQRAIRLGCDSRQCPNGVLIGVDLYDSWNRALDDADTVGAVDTSQAVRNAVLSWTSIGQTSPPTAVRAAIGDLDRTGKISSDALAGCLRHQGWRLTRVTPTLIYATRFRVKWTIRVRAFQEHVAVHGYREPTAKEKFLIRQCLPEVRF